jgi:hypothetical protein
MLDPRAAPCEKAVQSRGTTVPPTKTLTEGQRAYEAKRAAKAGMSLEKWLASKDREREAEARARLKAVEAAKPAKPPGFFGRLLDRAHRPLRS